MSTPRIDASADGTSANQPAALRLYRMPAGAGTIRYLVEARSPDGARVYLVAPQGFIVASWRPDSDGAVHGQWISPFDDLFAVAEIGAREVCRALSEPATAEHHSFVA